MSTPTRRGQALPGPCNRIARSRRRPRPGRPRRGAGTPRRGPALRRVGLGIPVDLFVYTPEEAPRVPLARQALARGRPLA